MTAELRKNRDGLGRLPTLPLPAPHTASHVRPALSSSALAASVHAGRGRRRPPGGRRVRRALRALGRRYTRRPWRLPAASSSC